MSGRVVLGRYRIVAPLARGGMGIVYLGRLEGAAGFAKPVVIKTVIPDARDARAAQLFVREARILSNLEHPAVVGVLDFGEVDGEYIMVLEYVHGFHLGLWSRYVREARGNMPPSQAVEVMLPVLEALEFAHRMTKADGTPLDIVHRDVSPANILIDQQGHVKLHDFGIARMADDEFKTQDGTFRGTLSFTAPETLQGIAASPRSDLYACGVILYQLLAGTNPFKGEQPSETLHRVVTHVPPRLSTLRSDIPPAVDAAIAKAMEKDPQLRFESAEAFAAALRAARSWVAQDAQTELAQAIQRDFGSAEMPAMLGVDTLQARDAAWRAAQSTPQRTPLGSSRPPRASGDVATETGPAPGVDDLATIQGLPSRALLELARDGANPQGENAIPTARPPAEATIAATPPGLGLAAPAGAIVAGAPVKSRNTALVAGAALIGVLGLGGVAFGLLRKEQPPPAPKFLLIEKQADAETSAAAVSVAPSANAPAPAVAPATSSLPGSPAAASRPRSADPGSASASGSGSTLTAAFQKQRGRVEACFRQSPDAATPQLTLRFQVEPSGSVRSVELTPASAASSALGGCILGVARGTRFPAGDAPVAFTIPITARKTGG